MASVRLVKAHAYRNDFLIVRASEAPVGEARAAFARAACDRHAGPGADGLLIVGESSRDSARASMELFNADGSMSELSGNGVRCIAAWLVRSHRLRTDSRLTIDTAAGPKPLRLLQQRGDRFTFECGMGTPEDLRQVTLDLEGRPTDVVALRVGNPQCVVLGPATAERLDAIARPLATHGYFPEGTNVELASVLTPDLVRILIWERGVGPTTSSGTGTCAAAVAAAAFGGASRIVDVEAPGGTQRVEWRDDGVWLTGWAEVVAEIDWFAPIEPPGPG